MRKKSYTIGEIDESGAWLTKSLAAAAVGLTTFNFTKEHAGKLKQQTNKRGYVEYYVPFTKMLKQSRENYKSMREAQEVEDVIGDVTEGIELLPNSSSELTEARLDNLKARTALINQKLEEQKQALWSEWNTEFFETFSEAFAKTKNELISLQLNEEQITALKEKIDNAIVLMKDKLDAMYSKFMNDNEEMKE